MVKVGEYEVPEDLYYTEDWVWVKIEDGKVRVGITDYAQKQLNQVVFAELPKVGDKVKMGDPFGTVESVKSISDLVAPVSGTIEMVNEKIVDSPEILNEDPYNEGWILVLSPADLENDLKSIMDFSQSIEWHKKLVEES